MKIYKCAVTGDELFSDAKKITEENGFYKVMGKNVTRKGGIDESLIGANASQEEAGETAQDSDVCGVDMVIDFRYTNTGFGKKKDYQVYMKGYIKSLKEKVNPADTAAFDAEILGAFKAAVEMFKDLEFYTSESMDPDGLVILCRWEVPEGETDDKPFFYYYKQGVKEEKV